MRTQLSSGFIDRHGRHLLRSAAASIAIAGVTIAIALGLSDGRAISAQDKYTVAVPEGLAFAEFRGFETWTTVAVSQSGNKIEVILANPAMIEAYLAGAPGNGPFPDGARMAKIHWMAVQSKDAPDPTTVPGALHDIDFMVRDSKRFPNTGAWGYAQFNWDAETETFKPLGTGSACGYACHTRVKSKDYVFTAYGKR
jgi:cytochrome P460